MGLMPLLVPWNKIVSNFYYTVAFLALFLGSEVMFLLPAYFLELKGVNTIQYLFYGTHGFLIANGIMIFLMK